MPLPAADPTSTRRPAEPRDLQRVLLGYLGTALALLCGLPVLGVGWFAAGQCTGEGFRCLGWFVYGMLAAALVAVIALPIIAWRLRLGWWFALLAIALVITPLVLGDGSPNAGAALLGPGLAAWVSEPRTPDPATEDQVSSAPAPPSAARHWAPRFAAVLVLSILVPVLGRVV